MKKVLHFLLLFSWTVYFDWQLVSSLPFSIPSVCGDRFSWACQSSKIIQTENGPVEGFLRSENYSQPVEVFYGIPYAEPPIGKLRFQSPQPYNKTWISPRSAKEFGSICPQIRLTESIDSFLGSEDCLYINIYKPANATDDSKLPVMLWIHGGAYISGDSSCYGLYDATYLASRYNVIVVTFNYRLNALGFFALDSLKAEDPFQSTGNYALQDQRLAMKWVQKNIIGFGGDSSRVTVFGQSAGAISIMWHLVSSKSKDLFSAAIIESGNSNSPWLFQPYQNATTFYEEFAGILGCHKNVSDQLDCLRNIPVKDFIIPLSTMNEIWKDRLENKSLPSNVPDFGSPLFPIIPFAPVVDGSENGLTEIPLDLIKKGKFMKIPILLGGNTNEGSIFEPFMGMVIPEYNSRATNQTLIKALDWILQTDNKTKALDLYSEEEFSSVVKEEKNNIRASRAVRDILFLCSNREVATEFSLNSLPVYLYSFSFDIGSISAYFKLGNFHSSELPFVFHTWTTTLETFVPNFNQMSSIISSRWTNFAKCRNPNYCEGEQNKLDIDVLEWPLFTINNDNTNNNNNTRQFYSLELPPKVMSLENKNKFPNDNYPSDEKCDFWGKQLFPWHSLKNNI